MSKNRVQLGDTINFVTAGAVVAGAVIAMQHCVGIALTGAAGAGETIAVAIEGVFTVPKSAGTAWAVGEKVIWDASASAFAHSGLTVATGDLTGCAVAIEGAASGDTTAVVKLTPGNVTRT